MIVATAGHIDHGKSTLVKALSGIDTDRLPEEKSRGISIDLGFAYLTLPDTPVIGFVDVPGHERFVRNMLAGVCGIDYILLVVAADDGVMPQTTEHLSIVSLLGIEAGVAVITKSDRVSTARVDEVRDQVRNLLRSVGRDSFDIIECSGVTQSGIEALRARLAQAARKLRYKESEGRNFRFAVDRAFSIVGSGTVVTGTVFNHQVQVGDKCTLTPSGKPVRVRGIQKNGDATNRAQAGERCALNLVGVTAQECKRGDWVVATVLHAPTQRLDVSLTVLPSEPAALTHWIAVHVHTGTTEVMGRIAIEHAGSIEPGTTACAQLVLEHPIACLNGDRLIVRDQSARRTIGGGIVLDPFAPVRIRNKTLRRMQLAALAKRDPASALSALLTCHAATGVDMDHFSRSFNLTESATNTLINLAQAVLITKAPSFAFSKNSIHTLGTQLSALLQRHHQAKPEDLGMSIKDLRQQFAPSMKSLVFLALLRHVSVEQKISITGTLVSLEAHRSEASAADQLMWQKIQPVLSTIGPKGVTAAELAQSAKLKTLVLNEMLHRKVKQGELFRVSSDRFYLRAQFIQFAQLAAELAGNSPTGTFIAAKFRDRIGVNRTLAIEILDVLDRLGVTLRVGDARKLLKPIQTVFHLTSNIHAAY